MNERPILIQYVESLGVSNEYCASLYYSLFEKGMNLFIYPFIYWLVCSLLYLISPLLFEW